MSSILFEIPSNETVQKQLYIFSTYQKLNSLVTSFPKTEFIMRMATYTPSYI